MQRGNETKEIRSPFMAGLTQILDIRANFAPRPYAKTTWESDAAAFRADWVAIGRDLQAAFGEKFEPLKDGTQRAGSKISL